MIADTGFASGTRSTTADYYPIWSYEDSPFEITLSDRDLLIMENAYKAIETIILLSRHFRMAMRSLTAAAKVFCPLKLNFSSSGYLPKRIRRIRRSG